VALLRGRLLAGALFAGALFGSADVVEQNVGSGGGIVEKVLPSQELGHTITTGRRTTTTAVKRDWKTVAADIDSPESISSGGVTTPKPQTVLDGISDPAIQRTLAEQAQLLNDAIQAVDVAKQTKDSAKIAAAEARRRDEEALLIILMEVV
jgi:hypothetical protein